MIFKRKNIVSLLFVAVFVAYVLSPLMFPCAGSNYAGIIPQDIKTESSAKAFHIFFEKIICFKFMHNDGKEERTDSEIIVHKARTILPEDEIIKLNRLHNLCISEEHCPIFLPTTTYSYRLTGDEMPSGGFRLLSSGLSPPAA